MVRSAAEFIIGPRFARTRWRVSNHEAAPALEVPDRATAIREVARILRPGGRFSSTEAAGDPDRVKRTELDAFAALAGLEKGESWSGLLVKTFNYNKPRSLA